MLVICLVTINLTCEHQMILKYPDLDNYVDAWPLDVILIHLLKYWSSQGKGKEVRR